MIVSSDMVFKGEWKKYLNENNQILFLYYDHSVMNIHNGGTSAQDISKYGNSSLLRVA